MQIERYANTVERWCWVLVEEEVTRWHRDELMMSRMIWDLAHLPQEHRTTAKEKVLAIGPLLLFDCTVVPPQKYSSGKKKCNLLADIRGDIGFLFGESAVLLNRFPCRRQARTAVPNTLLGTWETETEIQY